VIAIAAVHEIAFFERRHDARTDGLLADVNVEVTADPALAELALGRLLKAADEDHLPQQVGPFRSAGRIGDRGSAFFLRFCHFVDTRGNCTSEAARAGILYAVLARTSDER